MGTSLKVYGLKKLVKEFAKVVHTPSPSNAGKPGKGGKVIFVNLTPPQGSEWDGVIDYHVQGSTDEWVKTVEVDWRKIRPSDWETQTTLTASEGIKILKDTTNTKRLF
jgi:NAD-dependent histone deacetylase SIR2